MWLALAQHNTKPRSTIAGAKEQKGEKNYRIYYKLTHITSNDTSTSTSTSEEQKEGKNKKQKSFNFVTSEELVEGILFFPPPV